MPKSKKHIARYPQGVHPTNRPEPRGAGRPVGSGSGNANTNGNDGMKMHGKKKMLFRWQDSSNNTVAVHDNDIGGGGGGDGGKQGDAEMSLDEEIYSIISKPTSPAVLQSPSVPSNRVTSPQIDSMKGSAVVKPTPRRRRPPLLVFDSSGTPAAAQRMLPVAHAGTGVKRGRPRKQQLVSALRPSLDSAECARMELERIQATAQTRMHIKMNLRGRRKLENWLNSSHMNDSLKYAIPKLAVDMRLLSNNPATRRLAISSMPNADLRIVEALKLRCDTREGAFAWNFITATKTDVANADNNNGMNQRRREKTVRLLPMPPPPVTRPVLVPPKAPTVRGMHHPIVREPTSRGTYEGEVEVQRPAAYANPAIGIVHPNNKSASNPARSNAPNAPKGPAAAGNTNVNAVSASSIPTIVIDLDNDHVAANPPVVPVAATYQHQHRHGH